MAQCSVEKFGEQPALVVERFDRRLAVDGKWFMRLPQEDFCQATATAPVLKHESDGGPGIGKIMELLIGSQRAAEDRHDFMRTQLVYWLPAAFDGHATHFSIFLQAGGAYRLTPRYDIRSAHQLLPLVYDELRKLAVVRMANKKPGQPLQPTALVHEAWLKIAGNGAQSFANRRHFFKAAANAMQQILIDTALHHRMDELLREHFSPDGPLSGPALAVERSVATASPTSDATTPMIGRYKLLERIGEGGFGEV